MNNRAFIVALAAIAALVAIFWVAGRASVERSRAKADAKVLRAQEHTKRAEGRHELLDVVRMWKRHEIQPAR